MKNYVEVTVFVYGNEHIKKLCYDTHIILNFEPEIFKYLFRKIPNVFSGRVLKCVCYSLRASSE